MSGASRFGRQIATIGSAIAVASVLGYLLQIVVGRSVSPAEYGVFISFWGVTFGLASSLSTTEQEVARRTTDGDVTSPPSTGTTTLVAAAIATAVGSLTLVPAVGARVFGAPSPTFATVVAVSAAGFAVQFATRGRLIGLAQTRRFGVLVVAEAGLRIAALLVAIALADRLTPGLAAVCVGFGAFAWLVLPGAAREVVRGARGSHVVAATRRTSTLMLAAALTALLITGFPTLVTTTTGQHPGAAGGAVFAALTVSRIPLLLVSPLQALTVPAVVRWRAGQGTDGGASARRVLLLGAAGLMVLSALGALAGWLIGPWVVRVVYGPDYVVSGVAVALLVASAVLLAGVLLVSAVMVAVEAHREMTAMWAVALAGTLVWLATSPLDLVLTTAVGTAVAPVVALPLGLAVVLRRLSAPHDG